MAGSGAARGPLPAGGAGDDPQRGRPALRAAASSRAVGEVVEKQRPGHLEVLQIAGAGVAGAGQLKTNAAWIGAVQQRQRVEAKIGIHRQRITQEAASCPIEASA